MRAIEYAIDEHVTIRFCQPFISCIGDKPGYWYVKQSLHLNVPCGKYSKGDATRLWMQHLRHWYWTDTGWEPHTPKQFETPEAAEQDYVARQANPVSLPGAVAAEATGTGSAGTEELA